MQTFLSNLVACEASVSARLRRESKDETKKEERTFISSTNNQLYLLGVSELRRVRSICLLGVQVAVGYDIDKYDYGLF